MMINRSTYLQDKFISVIIPIYKGERWFARCLDSLSSQTLNGNNFEVILVFNGPIDGAWKLAYELLAEQKIVNLRILRSKATNAAQARNHGLEHASGTHLTWIDIDDIVSPNYLESLAFATKDGVIPVAQLANVDEDGLVDRSNLINTDLLAQKTILVNPSSFSRATTFMTGKLIPLDWAKSNLMDERLRSGEDVAFYGKLLSRYKFKFSVLPGLLGATYYRQLVTTSVSRGRTDRNFMVNERAEVIRSLNSSLNSSTTDNNKILIGYMRSQASFIRKYINAHPLEKEEIFDYLSSLRINNFPWTDFHGKVHDLAICYNFAPFSDTGANVAAKRIRKAGAPTDVISVDMTAVRAKDDANLLLSSPYVARHSQLSAPVTFSNAKSINEFVTKGLEVYRKSISTGRSYKRIYSRSMWPASHFLAAAIKSDNPDLEWTAEFSDPVRLTTSGEYRTAPFALNELDPIFSMICSNDLTGLLAKDLDIFSWTELLPYVGADHLVFTNKHQYETMLSYCHSEIKSTLKMKSTISHHPTLPRVFYEIVDGELALPSDTLNIGYFGEFYDTRGLKEVVEAISNLHEQDRRRIALHIYTSSTIPEPFLHLVNKSLFIHDKCSYFEFLSVLDSYDCLIVNDAETSHTHSINPYLPSKYSDYKGSKSPIWSIIEPGSSLDLLSTEYRSFLGDTAGASEVINMLLNRNNL